MERLTFMNGDGVWCVDNENCFEEQSEHYCGPAIDRLAYYEDMEEQGRLVVLPCKVGDTVWFLSNVFNGKETVEKIARRKIDSIGGNALNPVWVTSKEPYELRFHLSEFGKTIFLTREQAEEALKGGAE